MVYGYCGISSLKNAGEYSTEVQESKIKELYPGALIFKENKNDFKKRPVFESIYNNLTNGDLIIVVDLTCFCKNIREGLKRIEELLTRNVSFHILNLGVFDNSDKGNDLLLIMKNFAKFEKDMIVKRCQDGRETARQNPDYREGRKPIYDDNRLDEALKLQESGYTYPQIVKISGISKSTLIRAKRKRKKSL